MQRLYGEHQQKNNKTMTFGSNYYDVLNNKNTDDDENGDNRKHSPETLANEKQEAGRDNGDSDSDGSSTANLGPPHHQHTDMQQERQLQKARHRWSMTSHFAFY